MLSGGAPSYGGVLGGRNWKPIGLERTSMAKLKTYNVTDAKDAKKMTDGVNKTLHILGLSQFIKCKIPPDAWFKTNAADGKVDILVEASIDPKSHQGPIKVTAKAKNGATSVMGIYTMVQAKYDAVQKQLAAAGLL
jgi:hypothetical protein